MSENKRCCFAGHSKVYDPSIVEKIVEKARQLIEEYGITDFWVGNYGAFDRYAASAVRKLKAKCKGRLVETSLSSWYNFSIKCRRFQK